ncbi:hypothetical protein H920_15734 [Fukomys damarensis]|uniref:Uncharacterized protein n=1 Tax=Fukomys damarensis TaxID=885580 RepID=A0A091CY79_FUKDA|nr:hypothetical protein H920_15734 [Fukomys damarensis]
MGNSRGSVSRKGILQGIRRAQGALSSAVSTAQVQQSFLVAALGVLLDVGVQGLAILLFELGPNFQHVHFTVGDRDSDQDLISGSLALHGVIQPVSEVQGLALDALHQVQEGIFQVSFDFLLDALQRIIRAVVLVSLKDFLQVAQAPLGHGADPLGNIHSFPLHTGIVEIPGITVTPGQSFTFP